MLPREGAAAADPLGTILGNPEQGVAAGPGCTAEWSEREATETKTKKKVVPAEREVPPGKSKLSLSLRIEQICGELFAEDALARLWVALSDTSQAHKDKSNMISLVRVEFKNVELKKNRKGLNLEW